MTRGRGRWRSLAGRSSGSSVFEETLLPHLDALYGLALRLTGDREAAEDLLQDAILRGFEKFHQLRDPRAARPWLVRIVTRTYLNDYARRNLDEPLPEDEGPFLGETPEATLLRACDARDVEAALARLPEEFRLVVLLADVEELPLREIAALCGCPVGTVASRLARGRQRLRSRLEHLRHDRGAGA